MVIDLNALENLTLNYGKGFEKISTNGENEGITDNDIYVINENSHNIFYLKGITIEGKTYYTNQDKDSEKVNLRYVEGIKIPEGYTYKGKESGKITIVCDTDNTTYEWTNYDEGMDIDNQITFEGKNDLDNNQQTKDNFIESAKAYNGYYQSVQNEGTDEKKSVIYLSLSENAENAWSSVYEEEGIYIDENNHTAYIPKGFKVSKLPNMNNIKKGLVIEEENTKNQYVWIEVPKNITENAVTGVQIENALKEYANAFTESEYEDNWYDGCGITNENAYNELKQEMLQSIKLNGGFYIARFEAGTTGGARSSGSSASSFEEIRNQYGEPVSQKGKNLYNYLNVAQAQKLASNSNSGIVDEKSQPYKKSLMFGIQWDLVCKFIQETGTLSLSQIKIDSSKCNFKYI